ncbi:hypothetical protein ANCDUO_03662 [Ancylostoma duodenale]|uniref:Reverse transcriptase domain-containing protein n=1 Tax=Ancylostoma duodenale TaxID=51022 RepID=A0A0C2DTA0_9BILA|nr:hypothetical protein ANCDUO_03662 [Ancylostoma duodenale]
MGEDSRPLPTINTQRELNRLNRLDFGAKPAPTIFQHYIDAIIAGLDGTAAYVDDNIVTGRTNPRTQNTSGSCIPKNPRLRIPCSFGEMRLPAD